MKKVEIEKLTLNIGAGKSRDRLEKGVKLLKAITNVEPVKTYAKKRIPGWGVRPGLPVGCKMTIRKGKMQDIITSLLKAKDNILEPSNFDDEGNIAFGIHEYIDIPGLKYDPDIGIMGLQACITLRRKGYRIKSRKEKKRKIPAKHRINKEEAVSFMGENFGVKLKEEQ